MSIENIIITIIYLTMFIFVSLSIAFGIVQTTYIFFLYNMNTTLISIESI